jgi:hypothetical protein
VRVIPLGPPGARMLTATEVAATLAYLGDRAPLFVIAPILVALPVPVIRHIDLDIRCAAGYEPDYSSAIYATNVASVVAGTRRINLAHDPTGHIIPGNRMVFHCSDFRAYQMTVQTVGVGYVIVTEAWVSDPIVGEAVRDGGPLWEPIRAAVASVFDALGTSHSNTAGKYRWPDVAFDQPSTLYLSDLYAAIDAVPGVVSSLVNLPAADVNNGVAETVAPNLIVMGGDAGDPDFEVWWSYAE